MGNLKALWAKIKQQVSDLWDKDKGLFLIIAVVALIVKFRDLLIDLLLNSAKSVEKDAKAQDSKLAAEENDLKTQADAAVRQAQDEPKKQQPVTDDWFKKK